MDVPYNQIVILSVVQLDGPNDGARYTVKIKCVGAGVYQGSTLPGAPGVTHKETFDVENTFAIYFRAGGPLEGSEFNGQEISRWAAEHEDTVSAWAAQHDGQFPVQMFVNDIITERGKQQR